jgi:tetratricopeptide (TPR) repeat protein
VAAAKRNRTPVFRCRLASNFAHVGDLTESRKLLDELAAGDLADLPKDWSWLPCLVLLAEVCIRVGDLRRAALVYERLLPHAERVAVLGRLAACYGPVARYLGDLATSLGWLDEAIGHFEAAIERCAGMGALPDLARAKQGLGRALAARGGPVDLERADRVRAEAASIARELGIGELLDSPSRAAAIPSRAESTTAARPAVLRREGDFWTVACADEATRVRHSKGVAYLAHLLRHSGQEFHAFDLAGQDVARGGDAGEALDAAARAAYKRRLADLREELAEAEERGDIGRAERLREEMGVLASELARALGLGGRVRRSGSDAERARLNVGRAIGAAVRRIAADCPVLGSHLARSVHTGLFCSYQPDPAHPLVWDA